MQTELVGNCDDFNDCDVGEYDIGGTGVDSTAVLTRATNW